MSTQTQTTTSHSFSTTSSSSSNITIPRGPAETSLIFFKAPPNNEAPFNYVETPPEGQPQRNYGEDEHKITVHDIRGRETDYTTDTNGFAVVQNVAPSAEKDFTDDDSIKKNYYPEVEQLLLQQAEGAHKIFIFDHTVRRSTPGAKRAPVNRAHIDQTTKSANMRVEYHMGDEAEELLKGRVRLINVWRPLNGPVVASPLAFADSRTVPEDVTVGVQHRYPNRVGETAGVKYHEGAKWHYFSGMTNEERILLQCYDSKLGARTPHSAFVDPRTQPDWPGRESIEVRALVFG